MRISSKLIEKLAKAEGFRDKAYKCSAKKWTIGFGTTMIDGKPVTEGMRCTLEQAKEWKRKDLEWCQNIVNRDVKSKLKQCQFDALVSFIYNLGSFAKCQTLLKQLNKDPNDEAKIRKAFLMYTNVRADKDGIDNDGDGTIDEPGEVKKIKGLINRREFELEIYFSGY